MQIKEQMIEYVLRRPRLMDMLKTILSVVRKNRFYKPYALKAAQNYALKYPHGNNGVAIETTLNCNAKCVMCARACRQLTGAMSMDLFKKIIEDCHSLGIKDVGLSVYGEPLMDPFLFERIRLLRKYDMGYGFFTNGSLLDKSKAKTLFELGGLKNINFSVCGYKPEVYEAIMVGLKRDAVYKNIIDFLSLKEMFREHNLDVSISTVKLHLNKKDIKDFVKFWQKQKGVNTILTADLWDRVGAQPIENIGVLGEMHKKNIWRSPCKQPWGNIFIYYDGRVAPCCDDGDERKLIVGNANSQNLLEIFNGKPMENLRKLHLQNKRHLHPVCGNCFHESNWFL